MRVTSVQRGGPRWVDRYRALLARSTPKVLQKAEQLPRWLTDKPNYDIWERDNLWMMFKAIATATRDLTLIALYNRDREANGAGGTGHLVAEGTPVHAAVRLRRGGAGERHRERYSKKQRAAHMVG